MVNPDRAVGSKLKALRTKYARRLGTKLSHLNATWQRIRNDVHDGAAWEEFHQQAHALSGSGAMFGFPGVSRMAQAIEVASGDILDDGPPDTDEPFQRIAELLAQLEKSAADPETDVAVDNPDSHPRQGSLRGRHLIFIIDGDGDQARAIASEVGDAGYAVHVSTEPEKPLNEIADAAPAVILLSIVFKRGRDLGLRLADQIRQTYAGRIPVIFISTRQDFATRLAAVRAGGADYFVKPVSAAKLVDRLDLLIARRSLGQSQILIVAGDPRAGARNAALLENAGLAVAVMTDASQVSEGIDEFQPELILMDYALPQCTGIELARVILQQDRFAGLPVVFLLSDEETRHDLLRMGLDEEDFLPNGATLDDLISLISHRIARARFVRSAIAQDNLTKVLFYGGSNDPRARAAAAGTATPAPPRGATRVLVIEDDELILEAISIKLKAQGMKVSRASGGFKGFTLAFDEAPEIIVTDYKMSEGSGDYLLSRLKSHPQTRDIPVVVVTGKTLAGRKDCALERDMLGRQGAVAFLAKPLDLDALVEVVQRHVGTVTA